jgi:5-oxopent-3-ene-1,2,5-tricarboxylate decarboxylase / 2-hydroxyhepta-2,4-diene-1,7-dioate isomerase
MDWMLRMPLSSLRIDVPPYRFTGTVIGALLNDPAQLVALGDAIHQPPHKAPPVAPVLAVRPRHTHAADGDTITVPAGVPALLVGGSLGIVIGRVACRVEEAQALRFVAGYVIAAELSVPLASHYRPAVRFIARDGFCPIGARVVPASQVPDPDALAVRVEVDGNVLHASTTGGRIRGVARLLADVSEFMTLQAGDVLLLGAAHGAPLARAGQSVVITIAGLGTLNHRLVAEAEHA